MRLLLIEDRALIAEIDPSAVELLRKHHATRTGKNEYVYFCGIIVKDDLCIISLPRSSISNNKSILVDERIIASLLIKSLCRYCESESRKLIGEHEQQDNMKNVSSLNSAIELLNDYISHGIYEKPLTIRKKNSGKINWKRTISNETPFISNLGDPVYLQLHTDLIKKDISHTISLIHAEVICDIDKNFGWLFSKDSIRVASELDFIPRSNLSKEQILHALRLELNNIYYEREIRLIKNLISYLSGDKNSRDMEGSFIAGIYRFDYVWEEMLRCTLPHVININHLLPKPRFVYNNGDKSKHQKGMVTDIICKKNNRNSIVDAKYYSANSISDSPGWSDVIKQLFYIKAVKSLFPGEKYSSWFIFPRAGYTDQFDGPLSKVSVEFPFIDASNNIHEVDVFESTRFAYFCPLDVMRHYSGYSKYCENKIDFLL